eukprot:13130504-Ditylum_brightwellii.AAC.1
MSSASNQTPSSPQQMVSLTQAPQPVSTVTRKQNASFLNNTLAFSELAEMICSKVWKELPPFDKDSDLMGFHKKHGFNCNQIRHKFNSIVKRSTINNGKRDKTKTFSNESIRSLPAPPSLDCIISHLELSREFKFIINNCCCFDGEK